MALYEYTNVDMPMVAAASFHRGLKASRNAKICSDRTLRAEIINDEVLIVSEEFGEFEDGNRRVDLRGLDRRFLPRGTCIDL